VANDGFVKVTGGQMFRKNDKTVLELCNCIKNIPYIQFIFISVAVFTCNGMKMFQIIGALGLIISFGLFYFEVGFWKP
jgi:hypothetical protein